MYIEDNYNILKLQKEGGGVTSHVKTHRDMNSLSLSLTFSNTCKLENIIKYKYIQLRSSQKSPSLSYNSIASWR